jgi:hypothetical protein
MDSLSAGFCGRRALSSRYASSGGKHVVSRQRPPNPLQLELTDRLDPHAVLDLHQNSREDSSLFHLRAEVFEVL